MEKLSEEKLQKFKKIMASAKPNIAIVGHLDPDSIACMKIFAKICACLKKNCKLFYFGAWDNPQNNYLKNAFALADDFIELKIFAELPEEEKEEYDTVLLDSSSLNDRRTGGIKLSPIIIIDHHPTKNTPIETDGTFFWIQSYGAAATMVAQLYLELGLSFEKEPDLATLALIALHTDTDKLRAKTTTQLDIDIFSSVWLHANKDVERESARAVKDSIYYAFEDKARDSCILRNTTALFFLGYIEKEKVGYLSFLADSFSEYEEMKTVFVAAIGNDNAFYIKARSRDNTLDLDKELKEKFGEQNAGARFGKGAAKIPLGFWTATKNSKEEHLSYTKKRIEDAIFESASE